MTKHDFVMYMLESCCVQLFYFEEFKTTQLSQTSTTIKKLVFEKILFKCVSPPDLTLRMCISASLLHIWTDLTKVRAFFSFRLFVFFIN